MFEKFKTALINISATILTIMFGICLVAATVLIWVVGAVIGITIGIPLFIIFLLYIIFS